MTQESRVFVEWWGGSSYTLSYPWEYLEVFENIEAAKDALVSRYETGHWKKQDFEYVNRDAESTFTPAVGEDSNMWLWYEKPIEDSEHYPSAVIHLRYTGDGVEAYVE